VELLVVIAIIAVLIGLLIPAVIRVREAANRTTCSANLKQVALALHNYHDTHRSFPWGEGPGDKRVVVRRGCCWGTWQMLILPYIEQGNLASVYVNLGGNDSSGPRYNGPGNNQNVTSKRIGVLTCPSDTPNAPYLGLDGLPVTSHNYVVNYGNTNNYQVSISTPVIQTFQGAPFGWERPVRLAEITDGTSTTLMAAEAVQGGGHPPQGDLRGLTWWAPAAQFTTVYQPNSSSPDIVTQNCLNEPARNLLCVDNNGLWSILAARSRHPGGVQVALCDASVRFVKDSIDIKVWRALSTTRGGETISDH
jgi:type II secretory pathway pseudopilin PulG